MSFLEDPSGTLDFPSVKQSFGAGEFNRLPNAAPNFGLTSSTIWFRISLQSQSAHYMDAMVTVHRPILDIVDVYIETSATPARTTPTYRLGDDEPATSRPIFHPSLAFPLVLPSHDSATIWLKVEAQDTLFSRFSLSTPTAFHANAQRRNMVHAMYCGLMLLLMFYNLFLYSVLRDVSFLGYVGYLFGVTWLQAHQFGFIYLYVFPESPAFQDIAAPLGIGVGMACAALFTSHFLDVRKLSNKLHKGLMVCVYASALQILLVCVDVATGIIWGVGLVFILGPTIFACALLAWRKRSPGSGYFLTAWSVVIGAAVIMGLSRLGAIPISFWTEHALELGTAADGLLLSFALSSKWAGYKEANERAIRESLTSQQEQEKAELQLAHANEVLIHTSRLSSIGAMVAGVGHEIRNPISLIQQSQRLVEELLEEEHSVLESWLKQHPEGLATWEQLREKHGTIQKFNGNIRMAGDTLKEISSALLVHVRKQDGAKPAPASLADIIESSLLLTRSKTRLLKVNQIHAELPWVSCRRSQIVQVLSNLLNNAADVLAEERLARLPESFIGAIEISGQEESRASTAGVALCLKDNGPGIEPSVRETLFKPFVTTKPEGVGTGLGLSISAMIVEQHGGTLQLLDSQENEGARFEIWLPLEFKSPEAPGPEPSLLGDLT